MVSNRLEFLTGRPWRAVAVAPEPLRVPTMLSIDERKLLYSLARDYAAGDGAIVDAGCFLGGSTVSLLAGVRDRGRAWTGPPVASFDRFRVEAYTIPQYFSDDPSIRVGDSFRPHYDANVAGFGVPHVVHEGDITKIGWPGGPIEILFLDVLKSWKINDAVLRDFFPHLVPGRSVIVQQDYGWGAMPWIPITMELMRDSVLLVDAMEWGSHVFFLEREVPAELIQRGVSGFDHDEQLELIDRAVDAATGWARGMLEITHATVVAERDGTDAALAEFAQIAEQYAGHPYVLACLVHAREGLETGWDEAAVTHGERLAATPIEG